MFDEVYKETFLRYNDLGYQSGRYDRKVHQINCAIFHYDTIDLLQQCLLVCLLICRFVFVQYF